MFNVGPGEVIIVALVLLIAVGPEQLPGVIRRAGRAVSQVRSMTEGLRSDFMAGMDEIERATDPKTWSEQEASAPSKVKPSSNAIAAQNSSAGLSASSDQTGEVEAGDASDDSESAADESADAGLSDDVGESGQPDDSGESDAEGDAGESADAGGLEESAKTNGSGESSNGSDAPADAAPGVEEIGGGEENQREDSA